MAVGVNALWIAPFFGPLDKSILVLLPAAMLASILPDIDATAAKIHFIGGGVLGIFRGAFGGRYFHHRGIMHSLPVALVILSVMLGIFHSSFPALPYVFATSYFSHSIIDGFNTGVGFLYPFVGRRFALVPKFLRTPVGGAADNLFFFMACLGILLFFLAFKSQFFPSSLNLR